MNQPKEQILETPDAPSKLAVTASDPSSEGRNTFTNSTGGAEKVEGPSDETKSNTEESKS